MMRRSLTVLVSGMLAGVPGQGGATWAVLQYLLGLRLMGCEVYFVEPLEEQALAPAGAELSSSINASYFQAVVEEFELNGRAALLLAGTRRTYGLPYSELQRVAGQATVLLNISGMLTDEDLLARVPVRVYLDLDPAFNQLWQTSAKIDMRFAGHMHFVTVGLNLGAHDCLVPTCGIDWIKTTPPVVLEHWRPGGATVYDALTSVLNWRGYGSIEHEGILYGQKAHSLRSLFELPARTREKFMLALAIHPAEQKDLEALARYGWQLLDPSEVAGTPASYRQFIEGSKAELGVAKSGYVVSLSGWFSDRSACYLAAGRPVIAQETGFSRSLPAGAGLFSFNDTDGALAAIEELNRDYQRHAKAAREIAVEYFASERVLKRLFENVGVNL